MEGVKQFEVWWAELQEPTGRRVITSNIRQIASEVPFGEQEGLPQPCVANCDNIRIIPKGSLTKRAGQLAPERWVEVKRAVGAALG